MSSRKDISQESGAGPDPEPTGGKNHDFDPEAQEEREIGREMVDKSTGLGSVVAHFYRGEMGRATTWRQRLDATTNWAVTVLAAILVYAFSARGRDEILLAGLIVMVVFLAIEARRYQDYDVFRARARLLQENLFANALDPSRGVEQRDWRAALSKDYRDPDVKTSYIEALARRLRRVYLPLLLLLLVTWIFKITAMSEAPWLEVAAAGAVPGSVVAGGVACFVLAALIIAFWPPSMGAEEADRDDDAV